MIRFDGRDNRQLRSVSLTKGFSRWAEGSVLIEVGNTKVLCNASAEERVPAFLKGVGQGWVTAEYGMLPRATQTRSAREANAGRPSGRTSEIQRLIGRSLRAVTDLKALGERTIVLDCDVLQADGGTRTAAITGAFAALALALRKLQREGLLSTLPLKDWLAAVSVGKVAGAGLCLDLVYDEDSQAEVDMNVVMTGAGDLVEIQGTAEKTAFSRKELGEFLDLAQEGVASLVRYQKALLGEDFI